MTNMAITRHSFRDEIKEGFSRNNLISFAKHFVAHSAITTLATSIFTSFNPLAGFVIGAVSLPTTKLIHWACKQAHIGENSIIAKTTARVLSTLAGIALATLITHSIGFPVTFFGASAICLSTAGLYFFAGVAGISLIVLSVLAAQALLKTVPGFKGSDLDMQTRETLKHVKTTSQDIIQRYSETALNNCQQLNNECRQLIGMQPIQYPVETAPAEY